MALLVLIFSVLFALQSPYADEWNVLQSDIPKSDSECRQQLIEFKSRLKSLRQGIDKQLVNLDEYAIENKMSDADKKVAKTKIVETGLKNSLTIAKKYRDPAIKYMVDLTNKRYKAGVPGEKITFGGGTTPDSAGYRGAEGDLDLQGGSGAVDYFKRMMDKIVGGGKPVGNADPGYTAFKSEDIDVTLHKQGKLGNVGDSSWEEQIREGAKAKDTYLASGMEKDQIIKKEVIVLDHVKKAGYAIQGSGLVFADPERLQQFSKGTLKALRDSGLSGGEIASTLRAAGYPGTAEQFMHQLNQFAKKGFSRKGAQDAVIDPTLQRVFQEAGVKLLQRSELKARTKAEYALQIETKRIKMLQNEQDKLKKSKKTLSPEDVKRIKTLSNEITHGRKGLIDAGERLKQGHAVNKTLFSADDGSVHLPPVGIDGHIRARSKYIEYMSDAPTGRKIALTELMDLASSDPESALNVINELPDDTLRKMQREPSFTEMAKRLKDWSLTTLNQNIPPPGWLAYCKSKIDPVNNSINADIQKSAAGRGLTKGMKIYGNINEAKAYYQAWEQGGPEALLTEIGKARIPFMSTIEHAMLGRYWMATWDVFKTVIPPLGLAEGAGMLTVQILQGADTFIWDESQELLLDELYANAVFKLKEGGVKTVGDVKLGQYEFVSVEHKGKIFTRDNLLDEAMEWVLGDWDTEWYLRKHIVKSNPALVAIEEMLKHPDAGSKLKAKFREKFRAEWKKTKIWWTKELIRRMESRKNAENAALSGNMPRIKDEFLRLIHELQIEEPVFYHMSQEWDSSYLKQFGVWLRSAGRDTFRLAENQSEAERAAAVVLEYLTSYQNVLATRQRVESLLELRGAELEDEGLRVLTGSGSLTGKRLLDEKEAADWGAFAVRIKKDCETELLGIKQGYIAQACLDTPFDKETYRQLITHHLWKKAWRLYVRIYQDQRDSGNLNNPWSLDTVLLDAGARQKLKIIKDPDAGVKRYRFYHDAIVALLQEYESHYAGKPVTTVDVMVSVQNKSGKTLAVTNATVSLLGVDTALKIPAVTAGRYRISQIVPGRYTLAVAARGLKAEDGADQFKCQITVDEGTVHNERVHLFGGGDPANTIDSSSKDGKNDTSGITVTIMDSMTKELLKDVSLRYSNSTTSRTVKITSGVTRMGIMPGKYRFALNLPGYKELYDQKTVDHGTTVSFSMRKIKPLIEGERKLLKLNLHPTDIIMGPAENRYVCATALFARGPILAPREVTASAGWTSSDSSIATVREGLIEGQGKPGHCRIEASYAWNGELVKASCDVLVAQKSGKAPDIAISAIPERLFYAPGEEIKFMLATKETVNQWEISWFIGPAEYYGSIVSHKFDEAGTYTVRAVIKSRLDGKEDSISRSLTVRSHEPEQRISVAVSPAPPYKPGQTIEFEIIGARGEVVSWSAEGETRQASTRPKFSYQFKKPGKQTVTCSFMPQTENNVSLSILKTHLDIGSDTGKEMLAAKWVNRFKLKIKKDAPTQVLSSYWVNPQVQWSEPQRFMDTGRDSIVLANAEASDAYNTGWVAFIDTKQNKVRFLVLGFNQSGKTGYCVYKGTIDLHGRTPAPRGLRFVETKSRAAVLQWRGTDGSIGRTRIYKYPARSDSYAKGGIEEITFIDGKVDGGRSEKSAEKEEKFTNITDGLRTRTAPDGRWEIIVAPPLDSIWASMQAMHTGYAGRSKKIWMCNPDGSLLDLTTVPYKEKAQGRGKFHLTQGCHRMPLIARTSPAGEVVAIKLKLQKNVWPSSAFYVNYTKRCLKDHASPYMGPGGAANTDKIEIAAVIKELRYGKRSYPARLFKGKLEVRGSEKGFRQWEDRWVTVGNKVKDFSGAGTDQGPVVIYQTKNGHWHVVMLDFATGNIKKSYSSNSEIRLNHAGKNGVYLDISGKTYSFDVYNKGLKEINPNSFGWK